MPEGVSPELKRIPDAPYVGSGSSPREKPHQLKTEINVPPHPSETFPWLPKEEYFRQRDEYVPTMIPVVEKAIVGSNSQFKYRDNPEITKTVATLFSRAVFVSEYLETHPPQKYDKKLITLRLNELIVNSGLVAIMGEEFQLGEREIKIEDYNNLTPSQIDQLKLKGIHISFNFNRLGDHVKFIEDMATEDLIKGLPEDFVKNYKAQMIEEEGIEQEGTMVHEMAHAFYIIKAASNLESLRKFIEEMKNYRSSPPDRDEDLPEKELCLYTDAPLEQDAHKWEAAFMHRYYPDRIAEFNLNEKS